MPVTSTHKSYDSMFRRWVKCRDVYDGSTAIKAKGSTYLPMVGAHKNNPEKYKQYLDRAFFFNAMRRTVEGLSGAVFQKGLSVETDSKIVEEQLADVTLTNVSLGSFALTVFKEILITARYGILLDVHREDAKNRRTKWIGYQAEDITSWRSDRFDGTERLVMVVLREYTEETDERDDFVIEEVERYRVLRLRDNVYTQQLYIKRANDMEWIPQEEITPQRRGQSLDAIPFVFFSPDGVSPFIQRPPLEDVADLNISHYHNMADLEWGRHFTGLPTPWVAGHAGAEDDEELSIGSGVAWILEKEGRAGMVEFTGQGLGALEKADEQKRKMMATLGARLLEDAPNQPETAKSVGYRHSGETASLRTTAQSIDLGLTIALKWHTWWEGVGATLDDVEASVVLNKDFFDVKASPEEIKTMLLLLQSDTISYETFYAQLQSGEWARPGIDFKDELKKIELEAPVELAPAPIEQTPEPLVRIGSLKSVPT